MRETARFGHPVPGFVPPARPAGALLQGRHARLEPLDADRHAAALFAANRADDAIWDYLPYGPFADMAGYEAWVRQMQGLADPVFYAITDPASGRALGVASYLRIAPEAGSIEVGHICLSPALQGTIAATEAMFLMMKWVFDAGYRRYEWKCDALNLPSRRAAGRFGFSYEGLFRQAGVVKGRNRDTAWYAVIDSEWPALRAAYESWLDPANFTPAGRQVQRLSDLTRPLLAARDPAFG
jgi:RimJ/RimL family protein N-acetyltransferase